MEIVFVVLLVSQFMLLVYNVSKNKAAQCVMNAVGIIACLLGLMLTKGV